MGSEFTFAFSSRSTIHKSHLPTFGIGRSRPRLNKAWCFRTIMLEPAVISVGQLKRVWGDKLGPKAAPHLFKALPRDFGVLEWQERFPYGFCEWSEKMWEAPDGKTGSSWYFLNPLHEIGATQQLASRFTKGWIPEERFSEYLAYMGERVFAGDTHTLAVPQEVQKLQEWVNMAGVYDPKGGTSYVEPLWRAKERTAAEKAAATAKNTRDSRSAYSGRAKSRDLPPPIPGYHSIPPVRHGTASQGDRRPRGGRRSFRHRQFQGVRQRALRQGPSAGRNGYLAQVRSQAASVIPRA